MDFARIASMLVLLGGTILTGCRCPSGCCLPATPSAPCPGTNRVVGDESAEGALAAAVASDRDEANLTPLPRPEETYRALDADACQCTAAANATVANMIELERHWARIVIECDSRYVQKNMCLHRDVLALWTTKVRNKAAADALESFYQLAGLEARKRYLAMAIEETSRSSRRVERFEELGLPVEVDGESLAVKECDLRDQQLQLDYSRLQANLALQKLLGCPATEYEFFWPHVDWSVDMAPLDADQAVAEGLVHRTDVRALQLLLCQLEKTTLRVARGVLAVADASLGSVEPTEGWIHHLRCIACNDTEVPVRCRQLSMIYLDTERLATAEIKNAVYNVTLQQQRVNLARRKLQGRRQRLEELESTRDVDDLPVFEISQARGGVYAAESALIERATDLLVARVKLRHSQGLLAIDCGFAPHLCCACGCDGACTKCQLPTCRCPLPACPVACRDPR